MCMLYNRQVTAYHAPTNHRHTIMQLCSLRLPSHCPLVLLVGFSWLLVLLLIGEWFGLATYSYCLQKRSFLFLLGFGLPSSSSACARPAADARCPSHNAKQDINHGNVVWEDCACPCGTTITATIAVIIISV